MNTKPFRFGISDILVLTCFVAVVIAITVSSEFYAVLWTQVSFAIVGYFAWRYSHVRGGIVRVGLWTLAGIFFCETLFSSPFPFGPSFRATCVFATLGASIGTFLNILQSNRMSSGGH